jgi:nitroreductase
MSFLELASARFSQRNFAPNPVEREKINYILKAGQLAPSSVNFQPWLFYVITQKDMLQKLWECYPREWFKSASVCIVVIGNHSQSWKRQPDGKDHCDIDVAIAIDHMTLAAQEQGLGTCWVCNFNLEKCRQLFNFAPHLEPIAFLPIGYASDSKIPEKKRKELDEIVTWIE